MRILFLSILMAAAFPVDAATNYYVSATGSDAANGTTTGTAWKTISKVNSSSFSPGDNVLFECGATWREGQLKFVSSGTSESYLTYGSYGTGDKPRILGSELETSWTNVSGNIWGSDNTFDDPDGVSIWHGNIYFVETDASVSWGRHKKTYVDLSELAQEYDWTWNADTIYIHSPTDPNTRYSGVEITQDEYGIYLGDKEYIAIDGLEIAYQGTAAVRHLFPGVNANGLIVENCNIHHIGIKESSKAYGIELTHSDVLIRNNTINNCGRRAISMNAYAASDASVTNVIIENNTMSDGFHTTGIDISNMGSGTYDNIYIRNNLFYHSPLPGPIDDSEIIGSAFIFCSNQGSGTIDSIYVSYNMFRNNKSIAILLGTTVDGPSAFYIYNNVFYGVDANAKDSYLSFVQSAAGSSMTLKNNIFYNDTDKSTFSVLKALPGAGTTVLDNNLYYNTSATRFIGWYGTNYSVSQWEAYKTATSQDANSFMGDNPDFISTTDYNLQEGSPAINAGVDIGLTTDYLGKLISGLPDIGAYEYGGTPVDPADLDSDGIADTWETLYGLNTSSNNANYDSDNDGRSDLQEYIADTDPTNNSSFFDLDIFSSTNDEVVLWQTSSNRVYTLWYATNLIEQDAWTALPQISNMLGSGGIMICTNQIITPALYFKSSVSLP